MHGTQGAQLLVVKEAQQRGLRRQRQFADLIEQQRAAISAGNEPEVALTACAGEGACAVAEELGLEELCGQRGAVHRDEAAARGALAAVVRPACQQFLARAGLAADEHGHVHAHRCGNGLHAALHSGVLSDEGRGHAGRRLSTRWHIDHRCGVEHGQPAAHAMWRCRQAARQPWRRRRSVRAIHQADAQGAAEHVTQGHAGAVAQARDKALERLVEEFIERGAARQLQADQQLGRAGVEGAHAAGIVQRQQARAEGAEKLLARVDRQHAVARRLLHEQQVLDVRRRHLHQRLRVALP